jgi:hypothetical protein
MRFQEGMPTEKPIDGDISKEHNRQMKEIPTTKAGISWQT